MALSLDGTTGLSASGNITGGNILSAGILSVGGALTVASFQPASFSTAGNVTGNYIIGNGSQLTGLPAGYTNANLASLGSNVISTTGTITGGNLLTSGNVSATGNAFVAGYMSVTGNLYVANVVSQGNLTVTDPLLYLTAESPYPYNYDLGFYSAFTGGTGNTYQHSGLVRDFTDGVWKFFSNVPEPLGSDVDFANAIYDPIKTGNITSANIAVTGLVSATGNITGSYIIGNGSQLTGLPAGYTNANLASLGSNVISTTGTITGGNITGSNILTSGLISSTGNITGGNIITSGAISTTGASIASSYSAAGNITGGNILSGGLLSIAGNITSGTSIYTTGNSYGGNLLTAGFVSAAGNILSGNVTTSGLITATGNVIGGNVLTGGIISSTGNITSGNVSATNLTGTTVSVTGNITSGNISVSTGTVTAGNIVNGNGNGIGNIGSSTTYFNTVFAKATSAQYADLAEMYCADSTYAPGTVLDFGGSEEVTATTESHSTRVAGIVSTNPSYLMNSALDCANAVEVALVGRVPCRVVGTIRKGDRLVASGIPGVATALDMTKYEPGCIIGKALENYDSIADGIIEVAVGRF